MDCGKMLSKQWLSQTVWARRVEKVISMPDKSRIWRPKSAHHRRSHLQLDRSLCVEMPPGLSQIQLSGVVCVTNDLPRFWRMILLCRLGRSVSKETWRREESQTRYRDRQARPEFTANNLNGRFSSFGFHVKDWLCFDLDWHLRTVPPCLIDSPQRMKNLIKVGGKSKKSVDGFFPLSGSGLSWLLFRGLQMSAINSCTPATKWFDSEQPKSLCVNPNPPSLSLRHVSLTLYICSSQASLVGVVGKMGMAKSWKSPIF